MAIQASIFSTAVIRLLGTWAIVHGFLTAANGPQRWAGPTYELIKLMPGSPYTWGFLFVLGGLLALYASIKGVDYFIEFKLFNKNVRISYKLIKNTGLWIIGVCCGLFFLGFVGAAFLNESLSLAAGDRDALICILSILMSKAKEPRYV